MAKRDVRINILDAAIDLFWKSSYHATNMNDLSRAAKVNKATVYQHFRSKEEIAIAAVERALERTVTYIFEAAFEAKDDPLDRLNNIYQRIYDSHKPLYEQDGFTRGCPFVNIGVELATSTDDVREAVQSAFATFERYYQRIIEDLRASGRLAYDLSTEQLAHDLQNNMNATLIDSKIQKRPEAILEGQARARRCLGGI
ncbi:MAG: TetR/AcrR family transcriptional regulator [Phormidesmis sp.]